MSELSVLRAGGRVAGEGHRHLASAMSARNYIRIADEVAALVPGRCILDWGCGAGQMSWLLRRRGLDVVAYDVRARRRPVPMSDLDVVVGRDPVALPFGDGSFDAVLSCGVLEHVPDPDGSLGELRRILVPGGLMLIYNLPQARSYKELVLRRLGIPDTHEQRYTGTDAVALLRRHGFVVLRARRGGLLPHVLTGVPDALRTPYNAGARAFFAVDRLLSRVPILDRMAQSLEIVAERRHPGGARAGTGGPDRPAP